MRSGGGREVEDQGSSEGTQELKNERMEGMGEWKGRFDIYLIAWFWEEEAEVERLLGRRNPGAAVHWG